MKSPEREIKKLLARSSSWRLFFLILLLLMAFPLAYFGRVYLFESALLKDKYLAPDLKLNEWILFCKWAPCLESLNTGDFALLELPGKGNIVRKLVAMPGDSIHLSPTGIFKSNSFEQRFKNENIVIDERIVHLPKIGDTVFFDSLNDVELDYALNILRKEKIPFYVKALPYAGKDSLPLELAGNTKIGSRPVSIREIQGLPWQELHLVANQIQMQIHSSDPVTFKRKIFNPLDSTQIQFFITKENMYYFLCVQGEHCADSREIGYIPESQIKGKLIYPKHSKQKK